MNYKIVLILGFQLYLFTVVNAQENFKLAGLGSAFYSQADVKDNNQNTSFSIIEHGAFFNIPHVFKNKRTVWINGLGYSWLEITGNDLPMAVESQNEEQLHAIYYQTIIAHKINERWNILANLKPTLATDFEENLSSDDFVLQGGILATRTMNKQFKLGGGFVSTMRFGKPFLLPVLSLNYQKGKHSIEALLPIKLTYKYSIGKKERLHIGVRHTANGGEFNLSRPDNNTISSIDKIRYTRLNLGVGIDYNITKMINIDLFAGTSIRRQYDLNDTADELYEFDLKESPFVQLGITLVPRKKKK